MKFQNRLDFTGWFLFPAFLLLLHGASVCEQSKSPSGYHLIQKIPLGGGGKWDRLTFDPKSRRLFIPRSSHVMVVELDYGKVAGDIPNTQGVHGVALAPGLNRGFTSNGKDSSVTIFDLQTFGILDSVHVGRNPDAIVYDSASQRVFAFNTGSSSATAIDAQAGTVAGTIPLGGHPESAVSDDQGRVYVDMKDENEIVVLDARKLKIEARWPVAPGEDPGGIAMDRANRRLFIGCANKLMVVLNADDGHGVTTVPIGKGVDAMAFDSKTGLAFSSNGAGTLTVIHEDSPETFSVLENVHVQKPARTMAFDPRTHRVILAAADAAPGSLVLLLMGR